MQCKDMVCCFIGHRKIEITSELIERLKTVIENLIVNKNVFIFVFGSRSEFDSLCHSLVTEYKKKYLGIKRIVYTCKHELCVLEEEREELERISSDITNKKVKLLSYEEEYSFSAKYLAGKASYVERNCAMIDNSDFCIFYYDKNYKPDIRKLSKRSLYAYQPRSGTKLAYEYATKKNKNIILINE